MDKLKDVVAQRTLEIVDEHGQPSGSATTLLGAPTEHPDGYWICR